MSPMDKHHEQHPQKDYYSSPEEEEDEEQLTDRQIKRRSQNREAAQRCRDRKKAAAGSVVQEYKKYLSLNTEIKHTIRQLEREKAAFEKTLSEHLKDPMCHKNKNRSKVAPMGNINQPGSHVPHPSSGSQESKKDDQNISQFPVTSSFHSLHMPDHSLNRKTVSCTITRPELTQSETSLVEKPGQTQPRLHMASKYSNIKQHAAGSISEDQKEPTKHHTHSKQLKRSSDGKFKSPFPPNVANTPFVRVLPSQLKQTSVDTSKPTTEHHLAPKRKYIRYKLPVQESKEGQSSRCYEKISSTIPTVIQHLTDNSDDEEKTDIDINEDQHDDVVPMNQNIAYKHKIKRHSVQLSKKGRIIRQPTSTVVRPSGSAVQQNLFGKTLLQDSNAIVISASSPAPILTAAFTSAPNSYETDTNPIDSFNLGKHTSVVTASKSRPVTEYLDSIEYSTVPYSTTPISILGSYASPQPVSTMIECITSTASNNTQIPVTKIDSVTTVTSNTNWTSTESPIPPGAGLQRAQVVDSRGNSPVPSTDPLSIGHILNISMDLQDSPFSHEASMRSQQCTQILNTNNAQQQHSLQASSFTNQTTLNIRDQNTGEMFGPSGAQGMSYTRPYINATCTQNNPWNFNQLCSTSGNIHGSQSLDDVYRYPSISTSATFNMQFPNFHDMLQSEDDDQNDSSL